MRPNFKERRVGNYIYSKGWKLVATTPSILEKAVLLEVPSHGTHRFRP